jgi:hypothetical protein
VRGDFKVSFKVTPTLAARLQGVNRLPAGAAAHFDKGQAIRSNARLLGPAITCAACWYFNRVEIKKILKSQALLALCIRRR